MDVNQNSHRTLDRRPTDSIEASSRKRKATEVGSDDVVDAISVPAQDKRKKASNQLAAPYSLNHVNDDKDTKVSHLSSPGPFSSSLVLEKRIHGSHMKGTDERSPQHEVDKLRTEYSKAVRELEAECPLTNLEMATATCQHRDDSVEDKVASGGEGSANIATEATPDTTHPQHDEAREARSSLIVSDNSQKSRLEFAEVSLSLEKLPNTDVPVSST